MDVKVTSSFSDKGDGDANEDVLGQFVASNSADFWVIDGATSVSDVQHIAGALSDPHWHANFLSSRFSAYAQKNLPIADILGRAIVDTREAYAGLVGSLE